MLQEGRDPIAWSKSRHQIPSNSHFVVAAQLVMYVGAINVLIIFAVMFMYGSEYRKHLNLWTAGDGIA